MPEVYDQFVEIATRLENYFRDMQDMEFTIEDGHLYMLQTRNGKRTAQAALQIACDLVDEGMITEQEAAPNTRHRSAGFRALPFDFDIFSPFAVTQAECIQRAAES